MKTKNNTISLYILVLSSLFFSCSCKQEHTCPNPNVKESLLSPNIFVPYIGNERLKFLHNNNDTQTFIGQGKETYYISDNHLDDISCPTDHQSLRVKFLNNTTNDIFLLAYEYDQALFSSSTSGSPHTFYKFTYKNKTFYSQFYDSDTNTIYISNHPYKYVSYIGNDTNNFVAYGGVPAGILRIRINSENWDLIP